LPKEKKSASFAMSSAVRAAPRDLDHGPDQEVDAEPSLAEHSLRLFQDDLLLPPQLLDVADERIMTSGLTGCPSWHLGRGLEDRARLHARDSG